MASTKSPRKKRTKSLKFPTYTRYFFSLILIGLGASIMVVAAIKKNPTQVPAQNEIQLAEPQAKPTKLYIPKLAKILYISDGYVVENRWTISETGVSYLTTSAIPGQIGNSVIYGHNRQDVLGNLPQVKIGDYIYVVLSSGDFFKYEIFETKEIKPTQVEILNESTDSRLTIYTCSGFLDQARFVVVARLLDPPNLSI